MGPIFLLLLAFLGIGLAARKFGGRTRLLIAITIALALILLEKK
jgi:hypothetical protein